MATTERRAIGPAKVGAQAPATEPLKVEDVIPAAEPAEPAPAEPGTPANPDTVDPVNTEGPEYKAGYELGTAKIDTGSADFRAGYAAGLGAAGGTVPAETAPPATPEVPESSKAATATALLAAFPDDKPFCMDCLTGNLTLSQAHAKAVGHFRAQLKSERAARVTAETKLAEETGSPPPVRTATSPRNSTERTEADFESIAEPKDRAKAEYAANIKGADGVAVQTAFVNEGSYVGFITAQRKGNVKMLRSSTVAA